MQCGNYHYLNMITKPFLEDVLTACKDLCDGHCYPTTEEVKRLLSGEEDFFEGSIVHGKYEELDLGILSNALNELANKDCLIRADLSEYGEKVWLFRDELSKSESLLDDFTIDENREWKYVIQECPNLEYRIMGSWVSLEFRGVRFGSLNRHSKTGLLYFTLHDGKKKNYFILGKNEDCAGLIEMIRKLTTPPEPSAEEIKQHRLDEEKAKVDAIVTAISLRLPNLTIDKSEDQIWIKHGNVELAGFRIEGEDWKAVLRNEKGAGYFANLPEEVNDSYLSNILKSIRRWIPVESPIGAKKEETKNQGKSQQPEKDQLAPFTKVEYFTGAKWQRALPEEMWKVPYISPTGVLRYSSPIRFWRGEKVMYARENSIYGLREAYGVVALYLPLDEKHQKFVSADLAEESEWMRCGYSVRQSRNLTNDQRRETLRLMALWKIRTRSASIHFIGRMIRLRKNNPTMQRAIQRWSSDIEWLTEQKF